MKLKGNRLPLLRLCFWYRSRACSEVRYQNVYRFRISKGVRTISVGFGFLKRHAELIGSFFSDWKISLGSIHQSKTGLGTLSSIVGSEIQWCSCPSLWFCKYSRPRHGWFELFKTHKSPCNWKSMAEGCRGLESDSDKPLLQKSVLVLRLAFWFWILASSTFLKGDRRLLGLSVSYWCFSITLSPKKSPILETLKRSGTS